MNPFRAQELENGLKLEFYDQTNRYFGDYHRVCVETRISLLISVRGGQDKDLWLKARSTFGSHFTMTKMLERMAVPGAEVDDVRNQLVDDFLGHAATYMNHAEYVTRLITAELVKASRVRPLFLK
jgi:hypothetical protein